MNVSTTTMKTMRKRNGLGLLAGSLIGTLGGLIGLGGAEFRLPVLMGVFRLATLEAVILNKAMSLVVVASSMSWSTCSPAAWSAPGGLRATP